MRAWKRPCSRSWLDLALSPQPSEGMGMEGLGMRLNLTHAQLFKGCNALTAVVLYHQRRHFLMIRSRRCQKYSGMLCAPILLASPFQVSRSATEYNKTSRSQNWDILLRFWTQQVVLMANTEKIFLMISMSEQDQNLSNSVHCGSTKLFSAFPPPHFT